MAGGESLAAHRDVVTLFETGTASGVSDGELLSRFARREGGVNVSRAALHALVTRHGPMVLGVCRRALRDPNDVEDAFQATFLVLVRKADSLRVGESVGGWLYGVSRKVAARSRSDAARRASREKNVEVTAVAARDSEPDERLAVLDEEIARLPERYRQAVVLCDLDGLSHEAAARALGCAVGTVASRVSRGRQRLRDRLTRRGLAPSALSVASLSPALPPALLGSTVLAANGPVSLSVHALIEAALKELTMLKWKVASSGVATLLVLGGVGMAAASRMRNEPNPEEPPAAKIEARELVPGVDIPLPTPAKARIGDYLNVEVLEALPGRPILGAHVVRSDGTLSLGWYGDVYVFGLDRREIKVKVIEHLRKYINDDVLGLRAVDSEKGGIVAIAPIDSNMVFVEEVLHEPVERKKAEAIPGRSVARPKAPAASPPIRHEASEEQTVGPAAKVKIGDSLDVEVLKALPGRPLIGMRRVRSDGTISLGFYGDLKVVGLDRRETKIKVVNHLRKFLKDETLGLIRMDMESGQMVKVSPADTDHVFVAEDEATESKGQNLEAVVGKLDELIQRLQALETRPTRTPPAGPDQADEATIDELEGRLKTPRATKAARRRDGEKPGDELKSTPDDSASGDVSGKGQRLPK